MVGELAYGGTGVISIPTDSLAAAAAIDGLGHALVDSAVGVNS